MPSRRIHGAGRAEVVAVRLPAVLADAVRARAEAEGRTFSAVVRESLRFSTGLGHVDLAEPPPPSKRGAEQ